MKPVKKFVASIVGAVVASNAVAMVALDTTPTALSLNLSEKLWDTASGITGFSVVQLITYLYSLQNPEVRVAVRRHWKMILVLLVCVHIGYLWAIDHCFRDLYAITKKEGSTGSWIHGTYLENLFAIIFIQGAQGIAVTLTALCSIAMTCVIGNPSSKKRRKAESDQLAAKLKRIRENHIRKSQ